MGKGINKKLLKMSNCIFKYSPILLLLVFFSTCVYSMLEMFSIRHRSLGNRHNFHPCEINNIYCSCIFSQCFHTHIVGMLIRNGKITETV